MADYCPPTAVPFDGMVLKDLRDPVLAGAGIEGVGVAADQYRTLAQTLEQASGDLRVAMTKAQGAHEGPAAEMSRPDRAPHREPIPPREARRRGGCRGSRGRVAPRASPADRAVGPASRVGAPRTPMRGREVGPPRRRGPRVAARPGRPVMGCR